MVLERGLISNQPRKHLGVCGSGMEFLGGMGNFATLGENIQREPGYARKG